MFSKLPIVLSVGAGIASAATFAVTVSDQAGDLSFNPAFIQNVAAGDTVSFQFFPKNHTITQSSFAQPCTPLGGGFDSGFQPAAPGTAVADLPLVTYTVPQLTGPLWFHCKQQGPPIHCQKGMVFAINPSTDPTGNSFAKFQAAALALGSGTPPASSTTTPPPTATTGDTFVSPPPPQLSTVTVTVTAGTNVYTTTYASWIGSPANPTPAANPVTHTVSVGPQASLVFDPPEVVASINDKIHFVFNPKAHSVTQSTFNNPCGLKDGGFDTGLMPVAAGTTTLPIFEVTVNDTAPIWVYCKQQGPPVHCQQGMVFAVNAPDAGPNNFTAFQQLAIHSGSITSSSSSAGSASGTSSATPPPATGGAAKVSSSFVVYGLSVLLGTGAVVAALL